MGYGTNGLNSNGTLMNVGNALGAKPSIRLLGREKGYDTGHAMAALLGIRSQPVERSPQRSQERDTRPRLTKEALVRPEKQKGLTVGMKIITTRVIDLHSGISLKAGAIGVIRKIPGDVAGTIAEVDIHDGPLFDAWPGTICVYTPPSVPSLDLTSLSSSQRRLTNGPPAAGMGSKKCGNCRRSATAFTRFCGQCGLAF